MVISVVLAKVLLNLLLNKSAAGVIVYLLHLLWYFGDRLCLRLHN